MMKSCIDGAEFSWRNESFFSAACVCDVDQWTWKKCVVLCSHWALFHVAPRNTYGYVSHQFDFSLFWFDDKANGLISEMICWTGKPLDMFYEMTAGLFWWTLFRPVWDFSTSTLFLTCCALFDDFEEFFASHQRPFPGLTLVPCVSLRLPAWLSSTVLVFT